MTVRLQRFARRAGTGLALAFTLAGTPARAGTVVGPWTPIFKGIDYSVSTNVPGSGDFPRLQVVHAFRVDLTDPDIRLFTTPPLPDPIPGYQEVGGLTTSDFLSTHHLQVALSANFFGPGQYYQPPGSPMDVEGLLISEGVVVSTQDGSANSTAVLFDESNQATVIQQNWPVASLDGVWTAVSGNRALVAAGQNLESDPSSRDLDPRTAYGVSEDGRHLYLMGIDGRQPGYSNGANYYETAAWLLLLGAWDGVNMDGGGSTLLVMEDSTGVPVRLSKSSAVADSGNERTLGAHLGVYAKPVPGFINDVVAEPDDTTARITWTTVEPATTEVEYGTTLELGSTTGVLPELLSTHQIQVTGLSPWTDYYFRAASASATERYVSPILRLFTTNYVTTNEIFAITNEWLYATPATVANGTAWTGLDYDDSDWGGPGPGLLWIDANYNPNVQPKGTEVPGDSSTGFPYITYYFRKHITLSHIDQGGLLNFAGYIDDGAVFYLNGEPLQTLRMPATWDATTLASGYACEGNATVDCVETFTVPMDGLQNLVEGENVIAAEVHNYNPRSPDMTFGLGLNRIEPLPRTARLEVGHDGTAVSLSWEAAGFTLQWADVPEGPWNDESNDPTSPYLVEPMESHRFYRLKH
ncbi:MAG: phosphodiester glycosidase family protein, partial [Verrucomicrobiae bacterium]|nr:phosphodiester glycosidase family protein [Verrucomicrobiae bacterium]